MGLPGPAGWRWWRHWPGQSILGPTHRRDRLDVAAIGMEAANLIRRRKATTKTKRTRLVPLHPKLKAVLGETGLPSSGYLFPGRGGHGPITRQVCDAALRNACDRLGLRGYSTHSNRRTWAKRLDKAGVRLKAIQGLAEVDGGAVEVSGGVGG